MNWSQCCCEIQQSQWKIICNFACKCFSWNYNHGAKAHNMGFTEWSDEDLSSWMKCAPLSATESVIPYSSGVVCLSWIEQSIRKLKWQVLSSWNMMKRVTLIWLHRRITWLLLYNFNVREKDISDLRIVGMFQPCLLCPEEYKKDFEAMLLVAFNFPFFLFKDAPKSYKQNR